MELLLTYLIDIAPSVHFVCTVIQFLPIFLFMTKSLSDYSTEEYIKKYKVLFCITILLAVVALFINVVLPSREGLLELLKLYKEGKL